MEETQYGAWLIQLSNSFIKDYGYQMVTMTQFNDEIWLVNPDTKTTPIVLLTSKALQALDPMVIGKHRESLALVFKTDSLGLNISVNDLSVGMDEMNVLITPKNHTKSLVFSQFKDVVSLLDVSENPEKSLTRAVIELRKSVVRAQKKVQRKRMPMTMMLSLIAVVFFALSYVFALQGVNLAAIPFMMGGFYKPLVSHAFEVWRFITAGFVHLDLFHLIFNLMILRSIGTLFEPVVKARRFLFIFLGGIVSGNMFLFIVEDALIGWGMSAGLSALIGALLVYLYETQAIRNPMLMSQVSSMIFMSLFALILPGASTMGMFGGLLFGVMMGILSSRKLDWAPLRKMLRFIMPLYYVGVIVIMGTHLIPLANPEIKATIVQAWQHVGISGYAEYLKLRLI